jgi:hypothetical protein
MSKDELQSATLQLSNIMATYNLKIYDQTKNTVFCGKYQTRSKITLTSINI